MANAADPKLLRRVKLGAAGSYSEALWDEKALKVLPDAGLALIPLNSYDWDSGVSTSIVRLLDIDLAARDLRLRGEISHDFDARRADLIGNNVVSISQRVLIDADISDRDAPSVLSEVTLAWPVNRVFAANGYMFQIEDGNWYGGGRATVRVSPADASEEILAETDLGEGTVKAADYRDGKLYILRQIGSSRSIYYWSPVLNSSGENKLVLDIYDASTPSALALLGSSSFDLSTDGQISGDHLLWPKANRPAVVLDYRYSYWFGWGGPILMDSVTSISAVASPMKTKSIMIADYRPYWVPQKAPRLILYDTSIPEAPEVGEPVMLGLEGSTLTGVSEAADGLIVLGTTRWDDQDTGTWLDYGVAFQSAEVVEVQATGTPIVRPPIELPGKLFAVTELDADGFLAFTRTYNDGDSTTFQVSASDGYEAFLVASLDAPAYAVATAGGRRLFVAKPDGVERHLLGEDGTFTTESPLEIGWTPYSLRWLDGTLIGATWNSLFAADGESDKVDQWNFQSWYLGTDQITLATDGDLLVPFGDYGAERLAR